jgi:hypothetical protein
LETINERAGSFTEPARALRTNQGNGANDMTTIQMEQLDTGDVIEIEHNGETMTALVLLAADTAVILDGCDGSTPFVLTREELVSYRKFEPLS